MGRGGRLFEERDLVFYSQFLSLEVADHVGIGERSADFLIDLFFEAAVTRTKRLDSILERHENSCLKHGPGTGMLTPIGPLGQVGYASSSRPSTPKFLMAPQ